MIPLIGRWRVLIGRHSNHVSICSGLAAILNAKLLPAAVTYVRRITVSCMGHRSVCGTLLTLGNCLLSATGSRTLTFGIGGNGRPILATAGLLVSLRWVARSCFFCTETPLWQHHSRRRFKTSGRFQYIVLLFAAAGTRLGWCGSMKSLTSGFSCDEPWWRSLRLPWQRT